jgi:uncharacterized protein
MPVQRERDDQGRARNARPRDELGRPLPRGSVGVPRIPDELVLEPLPSLAEAQRLLDAGMPFHAHEILEGTWKAAPPAERDLWQGLAQLAVGYTHLLRGNPAGATTLLQRARRRISLYADDPPYGVDVEGLRSWADRVLGELAAGRADPQVERPRLRTP